MPVHPRDFRAEYVDLAVEMYRTNLLLKHLAAHAIAEMDNLAEVTAIFVHLGNRPMLNRGEAGEFRRELRLGEPVLGIVHDAHDSHKHGRLVRADRTNSAYDPQGASEGRRPEKAYRAGFFAGLTPADGRLTRYQVLVIRLNDGSERDVYELLYEAGKAWDREFGRLGF